MWKEVYGRKGRGKKVWNKSPTFFAESKDETPKR